MIEIYRGVDMTRVGHFRSILESEGIQTFVRNEHVSAAEAAISVFAPTLCILNDSDYPMAIDLIKSYIEVPIEPEAPDVTCNNCGETNPSHFGECWNCGSTLLVNQ
jgi:hypothetical protein